MTNEEAWTILEDALRRCGQEGVQTEAVYQALKHLSSQARPVPGAKGVYLSSSWQLTFVPERIPTPRLPGR